MGLMLVRVTLVAFSTSGLLTAGAASQSASPETKDGKRLPPAVQLKNVEPVHPREAMEAGVQGKVVLDATIALDGTVVGVKKTLMVLIIPKDGTIYVTLVDDELRIASRLAEVEHR